MMSSASSPPAGSHDFTNFSHHRWGAIVQSDGHTRFQVWAPSLDFLTLEIEREDSVESVAMSAESGGEFLVAIPDCPAGTNYRYRLPNGVARPDPASRFQPDDVHSWSQIVDLRSHNWQDHEWNGVAKNDLVIYEVHLGCWTPEGTYAAAIAQLDELVRLGITAIELMPLAQSAGAWNWGYDGVNLFAPRSSYGSPLELCQIVDAAHQRGLAVILDVVYNHFGPEGNYLAEFGPYLSSRHATPWGAAPNFDGTQARRVRDYVLANAAYWIEEFHFDGLRLDAIHCINDESDRHIATEFGELFEKLGNTSGRQLHLIAESNIYDPQMCKPVAQGGHGFDAMWCDDFLHSVGGILNPDDQLSARDYQPHDDLDQCLQHGHVFAGTVRTPCRRTSRQELGENPQIERESLIYAIQNHDFIGNHPQGLRLSHLAGSEAQQAAAALLLLHPAIPLLFMGEEYGSRAPFKFFVDFGDHHLREAVEEGRRAEFPQHAWQDDDSPLAPAAYESSKLEGRAAGDNEQLEWYRALLTLRREWRNLGLLTTEAHSAHWHQEQSFALATLQSDDHQGFVFVRLHEPDRTVQEITATVDGELILSRNAQQCNDRPQSFLLSSFSVVVGRGRCLIDEK